MSGELHLEIEITQDDRTAFRRRTGQQLRAATAGLRARRRVWIWLSFVAIGLAIGLGAIWQRLSLATVVGVYVVSIGFAVLNAVFQWLDIRDQIETMTADADARGPRQLAFDFSPEGVRYRAADREGRVAWSLVAGLDETPEHIFVMHGIAQGWILPRRLLSTRQLETLRELVREHVASGA